MGNKNVYQGERMHACVPYMSIVIRLVWPTVCWMVSLRLSNMTAVGFRHKLDHMARSPVWDAAKSACLLIQGPLESNGTKSVQVCSDSSYRFSQPAHSLTYKWGLRLLLVKIYTLILCL